MSKLDDLKSKIQNIPEFSEKNYTLAGYIVAAAVTLTGAFFVYEVLSTDALVFKANWNIFKSPLGSLCLFVGFFWALAWWGKFTHWSATPVVETRDSFGKVIKREEDYDISNQMMGKFLMPLLGHFVIEPIIYGSIIYYPIQVVIAIVGAIFPYLLSAAVVGIIAVAWMFSRKFQFRYHSVALVALGLMFTIAFGLGGYAINKNGSGSTIQMLKSEEVAGIDNVDADGADITSETTTETDAAESETGDAEVMEEEYDEQFDEAGAEGLIADLPFGTTVYEGDMGGFPIEFTITKADEFTVTAEYKNVKAGTTMHLDGESLPAMAGDISFFGQNGDENWSFDLTGTADAITGTASAGDKQLPITLHKK